MNKYIKSFFQIGSGTLISMIISLLTTPIITRLVLPKEFGEYNIFLTYSNILVMILCLGLDQGLVRFYYESDSLYYKKNIVRKVTFHPIIFTLLFSVLAMYLYSNNLIYFGFSLNFIILLLVFSFIQVIYRFSMLIVRLEQDSKLYSILSILNKLFYVLFVFMFIYIIGALSYSLMLAMIVSTLITLVISIYRKKNIWSFKSNKNSTLPTISNKELLYYSFPFIFTMGLTTLFQATNKLFLNHYDTLETIGIFSSAMSITAIIGVIQTTFNTLWAPISLERYSKYPEETIFYKKGNELITILMFFIGFTAILFKDIFVLLLGEHYREASFIIPMLLLGPIMNTISETTVLGLVFKKKSKIQLIIAFITFIVSIVTNYMFVPLLGGKGAAIATGISYIVFFALRTYFSNKYYYIDFSLNKIYVITLSFFIYAMYATFIPFDLFYILGYLIGIGQLLFLYKDTIKYILYIIKEYIEKLFTKRS